MKSVLIANRGEVACRIIGTCRKLGYRSIAISSAIDRTALHTQLADQHVPLPGDTLKDTYLSAENILDAAERSGAWAIHPGYGFLSEDASFAYSAERRGITIIGPRAETIESLGDKLTAKQTAQNAHVPVLPSLALTDTRQQKLFAAIRKDIGLPFILKASGGGGGRGIRIIRSEDEFAPSLTSALREANAYFGGSTLFAERFIEQARHVEVQILGDSHGHCIALSERDCSLQRNHQKILEEAPAPFLSKKLRASLAKSALAIGSSVKYRSAGTVEFLVAPNDEFYFLEVNTRLQVEHPVTEAICGIDLVALQLRIAEGYDLRTFDAPEPIGHALELRICSEKPHLQFQPSTGTLYTYDLPESSEPGRTVRVDSGYKQGDQVSHLFDSLMAKIICHGRTREEAVALAGEALASLRISGVYTNIGFLNTLLSLPEFTDGRMHVRLIESVLPDRDALQSDFDLAAVSAFASKLYADTDSPWSHHDSFRISGQPGTLTTTYRVGEQKICLSAQAQRGTGFSVAINGDAPQPLSVQHFDGENLSYLYGANVINTQLLNYPGCIWVRTPQLGYIPVHQAPPSPRAGHAGSQATDARVVSPLPGKILRVERKVGDTVSEGDSICVLESMKMEHPIRAPIAGHLSTILVSTGDVVESGTVVAEITGSQ